MTARSAASARATRTRPAASRPRQGAAARKAAARRRAQVRRRRVLLLFGTAFAALLLVVAIAPMFKGAVREITLPLRHEDIIRQQARDKGVDAALIAGVIFAESRFRDGQVSSAGALGLMQLTPETAKDIARRSGGTAFRLDDLATPQVNISYGAFYLRELLQRYGGNEALALAAYNAGMTNVDRWLREAGGAGRAFRVQDIPFPETRGYVQAVEQAQRDYRANYADELGL
jgi:soluble lytic murein transglycosylase